MQRTLWSSHNLWHIKEIPNKHEFSCISFYQHVREQETRHETAYLFSQNRIVRLSFLFNFAILIFISIISFVAKLLQSPPRNYFQHFWKHFLTICLWRLFDTQNNCCNYPKTWTMRFYHIAMHPKDTDTIATRGPLVLYRSPEYWGYVKISDYWGKEV